MTTLSIEDALRLAMERHQSGQLGDAEAIYRKVLAADPRNAHVMHLLGVIALQAGQAETASDLIARAIALGPEHGAMQNNRGEALRSLGRFVEAETCYRRAIELTPSDPQAHNNLGIVLCNVARFEEAAAACQAAIALAPRHAGAQVNLGIALLHQGKYHEALKAYEQAIAIGAAVPVAYCGIGITRYRLGQNSEALAAFGRAIELAPDYAEAHFNRALVWLAMGDFEHGWAEYEWRRQVDDAARPQESFSKPRWDGSVLAGRTLLLHAEQGFGDTIQFVRYAAMLAERGERVILAGPDELRDLLKSVRGVQQVVGRGEALPAFDVHLPLGSMPHVMETTLETVPAVVPYLFADDLRKAKWRERLAAFDGQLKVGIAWGGNPRNPMDAERSLKQEMLAPLAAVPGVAYFSLQKGRATSQNGTDMVDYTDELKDFADTAALIDNLDLVISVETAVAHLAGAMAKPVWTLLAHVADWRWLSNRADSPWYPTMRLWRQPSPGAWTEVIENVARDLRAMR